MPAAAIPGSRPFPWTALGSTARRTTKRAETYATFGKMSDFGFWSSAMVFTTVNESPWSINDAALAVIALAPEAVDFRPPSTIQRAASPSRTDIPKCTVGEALFYAHRRCRREGRQDRHPGYADWFWVASMRRKPEERLCSLSASRNDRLQVDWFFFASGGVARSSQYPCGYAPRSRLASRQNPASPCKGYFLTAPNGRGGGIGGARRGGGCRPRGCRFRWC